MEGLEKRKSLPQLIRPKSSGVIKVYSNLDEDITNKVFKVSNLSHILLCCLSTLKILMPLKMTMAYQHSD